MSLDRLDYLTREQLQQLHDLGGDRNANRILNELEGYVLNFRNGVQKVYYLSQKGMDEIGSPKQVRQRTRNIDHFLLRNQLYIYLDKPKSWNNENKITLGSLSIIPDAMFQNGAQDVFIEIDIQQTLKENEAKIKRYKRLREMTGSRFMLIFVTSLESRRQKLIKLCEGLAYRIYSASEIM